MSKPTPLADLTAAPVLYKVGDTTYEVSPLTIDDFGSYCRYVQFHDYYDIRDLDIPEEVKTETLKACVSKKVSLTSKEFNDSSETAWGSVEIAFLSLRHKHTSITREMVGALSSRHVGNIVSLAVLVSEISGPDDTEKKLRPLIERLRKEKLIS